MQAALHAFYRVGWAGRQASSVKHDVGANALDAFGWACNRTIRSWRYGNGVFVVVFKGPFWRRRLLRAHATGRLVGSHGVAEVQT